MSSHTTSFDMWPESCPPPSSLVLLCLCPLLDFCHTLNHQHGSLLYPSEFFNGWVRLDCLRNTTCRGCLWRRGSECTTVLRCRYSLSSFLRVFPRERLPNSLCLYLWSLLFYGHIPLPPLFSDPLFFLEKGKIMSPNLFSMVKYITQNLYK